MPSQIARGKRPAVRSFEVCAKTFGGLGAVLSSAISQRGGSPAWVIATVQPGGTDPSGPDSKPVVTLEAPAAATAANAAGHTRNAVNFRRHFIRFQFDSPI